MFATVKPFANCGLVQARPGRPRLLAVRASAGNGAGISAGAKVKVVKPIKVFHVPKQPELNLEGMEGTVVQDVTQYKGKTLSANLPYKVEFFIDKENAKSKFFAHLESDEVEAVADA